MSNRFWFLVNTQYEYNWIRLRQLTYLGEIPKMDQNWDPSAGPIPPKVRFRRSIFGTFADLAGRRRAARARPDGRWLLVGQRNVIGASRKNINLVSKSQRSCVPPITGIYNKPPAGPPNKSPCLAPIWPPKAAENFGSVFSASPKHIDQNLGNLYF